MALQTAIVQIHIVPVLLKFHGGRGQLRKKKSQKVIMNKIEKYLIRCPKGWPNFHKNLIMLALRPQTSSLQNSEIFVKPPNLCPNLLGHFSTIKAQGISRRMKAGMASQHNLTLIYMLPGGTWRDYNSRLNIVLLLLASHCLQGRNLYKWGCQVKSLHKAEKFWGVLHMCPEHFKSFMRFLS